MKLGGFGILAAVEDYHVQSIVDIFRHMVSNDEEFIRRLEAKKLLSFKTDIPRRTGLDWISGLVDVETFSHATKRSKARSAR